MVDQWTAGLSTFIKSAWTPVIGLATLAFWFGGTLEMLETPAQKDARIDRALSPLVDQMKANASDIQDVQRLVREIERELRTEFVRRDAT